MNVVPGPQSIREQILLAAERLFAERGYDGVSLREIGVAAGSNNNSAVQYHFGTKAELVLAVCEYRLAYIDERRGLLIAQLEPKDLRSWVHCYVLPLLEQAELEGSHYMSFLAAMEQQTRIFDQLSEQFRTRTRTFREQAKVRLQDVPEPLRSERIQFMIFFSMHAASFRERAKADGRHVPPFAIYVANLIDSLVGLLAAPVSSLAQALIEERSAGVASSPRSS